MADTKITALAAIGANPINVATFPIPMVDLLDNSMAASGTTKKVTVNQILGAGGTATLASATISGDLTVDTNPLKVDSANNRVGIGTASPAVTLDISDPSAVIRATSSTGTNTSFAAFANTGGAVRVGAENSAGGGLFTGSSAYSAVLGTTGAYSAHIGTSGAVRMTVDSSGNVGIGVTPAGTGGCLQLKSGITFPATQVASSDANTLDDYEEGTFTPAITGSTTAGTATYVGRSGKYTKIGNLVQVQIFIDYNSHTGTGDTRITGLPFTNAGNFSAATVGYANGLALTAGNYVQAYVDASQSFILLNQAPTGGGSNTTVPIDPAATLVITATYTV